MKRFTYLLPALVLLFSGCEDRKIKTYTAPSESSSSKPNLPGLPPPASLAGKPTWTVPANWKELPPTGMRAASFNTGSPDLDVSLTTFPGPAGGLLENVNRWRDQIGLASIISTEEIPTLLIDGVPAQIVELVSEKENKTTLGALFIRKNQSWFIKLTGPSALAAAEIANFRSLAESFKFPKTASSQSTNEG